MHNILLVTSSVFGEKSKSRDVALELLQAWRSTHAASRVTVRDSSAIPHLTGGVFAAAMTPPDKRSAEQTAAAALGDTLIEEIEAADTVVVAAPMYNFSISSTLKAWIDHITRGGRTFRYTAAGPEGLLKNKKVFVVVSRGGFYRGDSPAKGMDFQEPYLRAALGFVGLSDVTFIHVEGQGVSPEAAAGGLEAARKTVAAIVPAAPAVAGIIPAAIAA